MHPLLHGRLRPLLYSGLWVGIGALLAALLVLLEPRPLWRALAFVGPITFVYASVCLSAWYVCKSHPLGNTPALRLAGTLGAATLQASAIWVGIGALWAVLLARGTHVALDRGGMTRDLVVLAGAGVVLYAQSIVVHYAILAFESARAAERRLLESRVTAREAELRALRAQLNPHF